MTVAPEPAHEPTVSRPATEPADSKQLFDQAITKLRRAATLLPRNLAVTTRYGIALERSGDFVNALTIYLSFANSTPRVFEVPNRVGAILSMSDAWLDEIPEASSKERQRLAGSLAERDHQSAATELRQPTVDGLHQALLEASQGESAALCRFLQRRRALWRWLTAAPPWSPNEDLAYQRRFLRFGHDRRDRRKLLELGLLSTRIQLRMPWPEPFHEPKDGSTGALRAEIELVLGEPKPRSPECTYNAACCSARLYQQTGSQQDLAATLRYLRIVLRSDPPEYWIATITTDPDIASVRLTPDFRTWWNDLGQRIDAFEPSQWALEIAAIARQRWARQAAIIHITDPEANAAVAGGVARADDTLFDAVTKYLDPTAADDARTADTKTIVANAEQLHLRIPSPPPVDRATLDAWAQTRRDGADHNDNLSQRVGSATDRPARTSGERRQRWALAAATLEEGLSG